MLVRRSREVDEGHHHSATPLIFIQHAHCFAWRTTTERRSAIGGSSASRWPVGDFCFSARKPRSTAGVGVGDGSKALLWFLRSSIEHHSHVERWTSRIRSKRYSMVFQYKKRACSHTGSAPCHRVALPKPTFPQRATENNVQLCGIASFEGQRIWTSV